MRRVMLRRVVKKGEAPQEPLSFMQCTTRTAPALLSDIPTLLFVQRGKERITSKTDPSAESATWWRRLLLQRMV